MTQVRQYRTPPTYGEPLTTEGNTSQSYYRFFQAVDQAYPPAAEYSIRVTASPFTFTTTQHGGFVIMSGGSVSSVKFVRMNSYVTGQTSGIFPMSFGDSLIVTYSMVPTMIFVPT
jgi:hypothetical protein